MLNRWLGIVFGAVLLLADAELVRRDILEKRLVGNPPPNRSRQLAAGEWRHAQVGIYDAAGRPLGTSWTRAHKTAALDADSLVTVNTTTVLNPLALPGGLQTPPVRIETNLTYRHGRSSIDTLDFHIIGLGVPVSLKAEAVGTDFALSWQVGDMTGFHVVDSRIPAALGDRIRPFDELPNLYVGRRWKLDLLDIASQIMPQLADRGVKLEPIIMEVTRQETIEHRGERVETFVVEGGDATGWVRADGTVLRQEVTVPLLGKLTLLDETFDPAALKQATPKLLDMAAPSNAQSEPDANAPSLRGRRSQKSGNPGKSP